MNQLMQTLQDIGAGKYSGSQTKEDLIEQAEIMRDNEIENEINQELEENAIMEEKEYVSNCCSAPVDEDYMICPACQEHCDVVETE